MDIAVGAQPELLQEHGKQPSQTSRGPLPLVQQTKSQRRRQGKRKPSWSPQRDGLDELPLKKVRRIGELNVLVVLKQYEAQHEERTLDSCADFLQQSAEDTIQAAVSIQEGRMVDFGLPQLQDLLSQTKTDLETFRKQSKRVQTLRTALVQHESRLKARIDRLRNLLESRVSDVPRQSLEHSLATRSDIECNTSSAQSSSPSSTPTLVAQYFDTKGDVGIYRERLADFECNYQEIVADRDFKRDRGDTLTISDGDFHDSYVIERNTILSDLDRAEKAAEILAEQCKAAGFDIDTRQRMSPSEASSTSTRSASAASASKVAVSLPLFRLQAELHSSRLLSTVNTDHVQDWLENIQQGQPESTPSSMAECKAVRTYVTGSHASESFGSKAWRSYRTEEVAVAAMQLPTHPYVITEGSKLDVGLSIRSFKTDPGCLPRVELENECGWQAANASKKRWSVKSSPDISQLDITKQVKQNVEDPLKEQPTLIADLPKRSGRSWWIPRFFPRTQSVSPCFR